MKEIPAEKNKESQKQLIPKNYLEETLELR